MQANVGKKPGNPKDGLGKPESLKNELNEETKYFIRLR